MTDSLSTLMTHRKPTPDRPLLGLTVLVVEDSRFACEALRLLCLRSGARIRRADCLASARRHLASYRPAVVIVDVGLPDGSGLDLIRELDKAEARLSAILASSGDSGAEAAAKEAGADGFLLKPISSLGAFQQALLEHLPPDRQPCGLRRIPTEMVEPDPLALNDDLNHVASLLSDPVNDETLVYLAQFLSSLARSASDTGLAKAARRLSTLNGDRSHTKAVIGEITTAVETRMTGTGPF
jgi:CheY-like chemotaxis protein